MKKLLWILILLPLLIFSDCLRVPETLDPAPQLPPVTTHKARTFGCRINGAVWVPKGSWTYMLGSTHIILSGAYEEPPGDFYIVANYPEKDEGFRINIYNTRLEPGTYNLYDSSLSFSPVSFFAGENSRWGVHDYTINSIHNGTITFLRVDSVLAGTFEFEAVNDSGEVIRITDGRFDL